MRRFSVLFSIVLLCAVAVSLMACAPVKRGATSQGFIVQGQPNIEITVQPPMQLAGSGVKAITLNNDMMGTSMASMHYSVFSSGLNSPVESHAHIFLASLAAGSWIYSPETYPNRRAIGMSKEKINGRNFTLQTVIVPAAGDWFSELWEINGYSVAKNWLAMRWSYTPDKRQRIVAEYREPLPPCLEGQDIFTSIMAGKNSSTLDRQIAWKVCERELAAFRDRATQVFRFETPAEESTLSNANALPQSVRSHPNMTDSTGPVEKIQTDSPRYFYP